MFFIIAFLLILAPITFTLGIILPLIRFETFYFFDETPSLFGIISSLFESGDYILGLLIVMFSIVFPFIKQFAIILEALKPDHDNQGIISKLIPLLSKWSMMDVLLVALVIVGAKTSGIASAFSQPGLWFYALSTLLTISAHHLVKKRPVR